MKQVDVKSQDYMLFYKESEFLEIVKNEYNNNLGYNRYY